MHIPIFEFKRLEHLGYALNAYPKFDLSRLEHLGYALNEYPKI
jgi:hypothetical protein